MSFESKTSTAQISASLVNVSWINEDSLRPVSPIRPVSPCRELYDRMGYDRIRVSAPRLKSLHYPSQPSPRQASGIISQDLQEKNTLFVNPVSAFARNGSAAQPAANPSSLENETLTEKKPSDPKAHLSLLSLDNIHTVSILCWRRGRKAYLATSDATKHSTCNGDQGDGWHLADTVLFGLYRFVGYFVLVAQFTFLWSLLDMYCSDFVDSDNKGKPFPVKYTASMTDRDFGLLPLNVTIAAWDTARSASNVRQCREWVLECGALWAAGTGCTREADIRSNCPPWDYEKHLQGRNGSQPICYRSDGFAVEGGSPYYGSMTKGVILEWVLGMNPTSTLYSALAYRYGLSIGNSYSAEIFAIIVWSSMFFFAVFFGDICQLIDQCCLSQRLQIENSAINQDLDLFHPVRMLFGDIYLVFRVLFVSTLTPVSAMLIANAKGVQAVLSGAVAMTFLCNIDDTLFKSMQDSMMMSKTRAFQHFLEPAFKKIRNYDKTEVNTPFLRIFGQHFGRFRTSIALGLGLCLWITSFSIAIRVAIGSATAFSYFDTYPGFAIVGGIALMIYIFVAAALLQCDDHQRTIRSAVNVVQFGLGLLWVFVAYFKVVAWGLLAWGSDLAVMVALRRLGSHFIPRSYEEFQSENWGSVTELYLAYIQSQMCIPMYVCFILHLVLCFKEVFPPVRALLSTSWDHKIRSKMAMGMTGLAAKNGTKTIFDKDTVIGVLASENEAAYGGDGGGGSGEVGGGGDGGGDCGGIAD